jgi:hypothetical protein
MNDWEKAFWTVMDDVTSTIEVWANEIEQTMTEVSVVLGEEMAAEWEGFWQDWSTIWEEVTEIFTDPDPDGNDPQTWNNPPHRSASNPRNPAAPWLSMDWEMGLNPYLPATADHQPACQGCQHYHGYVYGGKLLVCGMHPYGSETGHCSDWEGSGDRRP